VRRRLPHAVVLSRQHTRLLTPRARGSARMLRSRNRSGDSPIDASAGDRDVAAASTTATPRRSGAQG
jgi:hypothetical protein